MAKRQKGKSKVKNLSSFVLRVDFKKRRLIEKLEFNAKGELVQRSRIRFQSGRKGTDNEPA